jgi:glycosyltransferase involved in cell wall biosynthesis
MRIVILTETFDKNMGYLGNMLPRYLVRFGVEVHLVTLDLPPYYQIKDFKETYSAFIGAREMKAGSVESYDGYTLHIMAHRRLLGYMRMEGLWKKLRTIRPDIVYSQAAIGWIPLHAALLKPLLGYKLFTGSHTTASTFPLARNTMRSRYRERIQCFFTRFIPGRLVSLASQICYGPTKDCAEIAWRFFGVQRNKVKVLHLGVDTDFFFPVSTDLLVEERKQLRRELGFSDDDIVCVYSGKMTEVKNALILAEAIDRLRSEGYPYRGLLIGDGVQKKQISEHDACVVLDFMPYQMLAGYYRASDIGVWPTNESISMLDAAACGIPLIVSDGIIYREHVDGNGLVYHMNSLEDLAGTLLLLRDPAERVRLGSAGAEKMVRDFSWAVIARRRLNDFESALRIENNV